MNTYLLTACVCIAGMYFFAIVQGLVNDGYVRGDDIRGAPYDWRKAPSKLPTQYSASLHQHRSDPLQHRMLHSIWHSTEQ